MHPSRLPVLLTALLVLASSSELSAQQFTGRFSVRNEVPGAMTLMLQQGAGGAVSGALSSNGASYQVEGIIEDGIAVGSMRGAEGILFFEAERWENELWVTLFGSDAAGQPVYDDYTEIDFVQDGTAGGSGGYPPAGGGNPLRNPNAGNMGAGNPLAGGGGDPYLGTFSDGNVTLQLQGGAGLYQGQVNVGGTIYPVQAEGGPNGIQGTIQAPDGVYPLAAQPLGSGLVVVSGGMQYNLARQGPATGMPGGFGSGGQGRAGGYPPATAPPGMTGRVGGAGLTGTGRPLAPGFTENHPQVLEWVQFLAGNKLTSMSSYSSGGAGGYSARTDVYLCSDRSFSLSEESSVSVDVGGAFGSTGGSGGGQGRWYVITNGQVVALILEFVSGEAVEFRLDYQNQQTYANGERVYVTPSEICG